MNSTVNNDDLARKILDACSYAVLSTAGGDGTPWGSPVWFVHEDDSTGAPGTGQAVYMTATAQQVVDPAALEHGVGPPGRVARENGRVVTSPATAGRGSTAPTCTSTGSWTRTVPTTCGPPSDPDHPRSRACAR